MNVFVYANKVGDDCCPMNTELSLYIYFSKEEDNLKKLKRCAIFVLKRNMTVTVGTHPLAKWAWFSGNKAVASKWKRLYPLYQNEF